MEEKLPESFRPYFWDVNFEELTADKNPAFVVLRVVDLGNTSALKWIVERYGLEFVKKVILKSRAISRKTANYWALIFNLDPKTILCLNKPYSPIPFGP